MKRKIIIFAISAILIVVILAIVFSPKEKVEKREYYLIYSEKTTSESKATKVSSIAKFKGGGAYVYFDEVNYYVFLMAYKDKESANKVVEKIQDAKGIMTISIEQDCDYNKYKVTLIDDLYDLIIDYDKGEKTINEVKAELAAINSELFVKLENAQIEKNDKKIKEIEIIINEVKNLSVSSVESMSQRLKYLILLCLLRS